MNIILNKSLFSKMITVLFITVSLISKSGCSTENDEPSNNDAINIGYEDTMETYNDEEEENPEEQGWRQGELIITYSLHQAVSLLDNSSDTTGMVFNSELIMKATSTSNVWVADDLSIFKPKSNNDEEERETFSYRPFYFPDEETPAKMTTQFSYNDYIKISNPHTEIVTKGSGKIKAIDLELIKPSLYGLGYELDIIVVPDILFKQKVKTEFKVPDKDITLSDPIKFSLYPKPEIQVISNYPYTAMEEQFQIKKQHLNFLEILINQTKPDSKLPFSTNCIGAITTSSKNRLTIDCNYKGIKWIPLVSPENTYYGQPETELNIKVQLKAK